MASKAVGLLTFNFGANMQGFDKAMKKAQRSLKKFGKNITRTGQTLSRNLTLPILGLAAAALKFGSDLEETDSKFNQVFSSIQKEAQETAKVFKDSFGLSELASKQLLADTGDLLVGFGFTEKAALDLSSQVNSLAVDLASFSNFEGGAEGASKALTKALVGETESAKALGIVIRQGTKEYKDRTLAIMKEQGVSILQAKAINNLEIAYSQSQKAIGDFSRTSGDFANQLRIVKGDLVDVASEMGSRLIPHAKIAIEKLKGLIKWFDGLSDSQKDNIVKWGLILAAIGPVLVIIGKLSLGINALIPIIARLGTFLLANPYILLAAAIAAVGYALTEVTKALTYQIDVQKELGDLNVKAQKSIVKDLANIKLLTGLINDENTSLEDQQKALRTLKETYPIYYDEIDETAISTENLNEQTVKLTESLMQVAKLTAYKNKLEEVEGRLLELRREGNVDVTTNIAASLIGGVPMQALELFTGKFTKLKQTAQEKLDLKEMKELEKFLRTLYEETWMLQKKVDETNKTFTKVSHGCGDTGKAVKELTGEIKVQQRSLLDLSGVSRSYIGLMDKDFSDVMSDASDQFKGMVFWQEEMSKTQKLANAGWMMFGDVLTSSLDGALDSQENFFQLFIKNIKKAIRSLLVQLAVMSLINALMGGGKAAFSLGAITSNLGKIMNVQGFQEGGIVTGPTTALIGEGIGTTAANPEVVAPLDKLKSLMGSTEQNITVTGKLIGNDIFLSNAKTRTNRLRTV